jgi:DNA replication protein DnaC
MNSTELLSNPANTTISNTTTETDSPGPCRKHGVPLSFEPFPDNDVCPGRWYCPACAEEIERKAAAAEAEARHRQLLRGIPPRYQTANFGDFAPADIAPVVKWAKAPAGFIYVHGTCGVGKTHLICAVQKQFNADGVFSDLVFSSEMFLQLHKSFGRNAADMEDAIIAKYAPFSGASVVLFDDVGAQKISDYTVDAWYKIVDRRYRQNLPTFFTSNLTPKELAATLGDRTASRIQSGTLLELKGEDKRMKKRKAHWTEKYD